MGVDGRTQGFASKIDRVTNGNAEVDYEHKEVHSGDAYYTFETVTLANPADTRSHFFVTPNTPKWMHFFLAVEAQGKILVQIREGITDLIEGATVRNRNRNYSDANATMSYAPSGPVGTGGTLIWQWSAGAASPAIGRSPQLIRNSLELVLKQNTQYEVRLVSGIASNVVSAYYTWYEHANVE